MSLINLGISQSILNLVQDRTLERVFHDAMFPQLLFRSDMIAETWGANIGDRLVMTRTGLMEPVTEATQPGQDPLPSSYATEQFEIEASQYTGTKDTYMPTSTVAIAPLFLRDAATLGMQAGQSLNRIARNKLFRPYLGGNSVLTAASNSGTSQLNVASINGFVEVLVNGRLQQVSSSNPITIGFPGSAEPANAIIAFVPASALQPYGPGTLFLQSPLVNTLANRQPVVASTGAFIYRTSGSTSIDGISASNSLTLQDINNTVAYLRSQNVPTHGDGMYHLHVSPQGEAQLFKDQQFQRIFQSLPDNSVYTGATIAELMGVKFLRNNENPGPFTVKPGSLIATGTQARMAPEIGAEVINATGFAPYRALLTGGGVAYEKYLDEGAFVTEAGITGKIGEFAVVNNGLQVMTDRIRYTLRAPLDRLQQMVAQTWSWSGDFALPSDQTVGNTARFKRAVVIEHG